MTDILLTVKTLLGISDASKDEHVTVIIETVKEKVLAYCKLSALPSELNYTVAEMVVKSYKKMTEGDVTSVKRGDVTVNFSVKTVTDVLEDYTSVLNSFRRIGMGRRT